MTSKQTKPWVDDFLKKDYEVPESRFVTHRVNSNVANYFNNYKAIFIMVGFLVASFQSWLTWFLLALTLIL